MTEWEPIYGRPITSLVSSANNAIVRVFQNPLPDRNSLRIVRTMIRMSIRNDHFSM